MNAKNKSDINDTLTAEFQLTELEERLEMVASESAYCCECFRQTMCEPL